MRVWIMVGSILGCLSVILGAFRAHSLKNILTEAQLGGFKTAVQYQFMHSIALILIGVLLGQTDEAAHKRIKRAGKFFVAGIVLFSGSIYTLTLGGPRFMGPITPLGGLCFMTGWIILAISIPKK